MQPVSRFNAFGLGLILAAMAAGGAPSALAEIRATGKNGLKTEVNGLQVAVTTGCLPDYWWNERRTE